MVGERGERGRGKGRVVEGERVWRHFFFLGGVQGGMVPIVVVRIKGGMLGGGCFFFGGAGNLFVVWDSLCEIRRRCLRGRK